MPSPYDLIQMINSQFGCTPKDTIEEVNELIEDIDKETWKKGLKEERDDYAERTQSCPKCGEKLKVIDKWKESRGEMLGREVFEEIHTYGCPSCDYIVE